MAKKRGSSRSMSGRSSSRSRSGGSVSGRSSSGRSTSARSSAGRSTAGRSRSGGSRVSSSRSRAGASTIAGEGIAVSVAPKKKAKSKTDQKMMIIAACGVVAMLVFGLAIWSLMPSPRDKTNIASGTDYERGGLNVTDYSGSPTYTNNDDRRENAPFGWDKLKVGMTMDEVKTTVKDASYKTHSNPTVWEYGGDKLFDVSHGPNLASYRIYFDAGGKVSQFKKPQ